MDMTGWRLGLQDSAAAGYGALEPEEVEQIIMAALAGHAGGVDEDEIESALAWAHRARVQGCLLAMVLEGQLLLRIVDGEPVFELAAGWREQVEAA